MKPAAVGIIALVVIIGIVAGVVAWRSHSTSSGGSASSGSSPSTTPSGLQITDVKVGTGAAAQSGDSLTVSYVGTLSDGSTFDSNEHFTFTIGQGQVIKGWDQGILGMKVGGERKLVIPPDLGYGSQAVGSIPPNSTLTFDVKLLDVQPASAASPATLPQ